jgi:outer membrane protein OmpA-like peptidoglycan-associated protein
MTHAQLAAPLALPLVFWCVVAVGSFAATPAQAGPEELNVEALVRALRSGPATRSFMRTQLPEAGSNLCAGQTAAAPGATGTTGGERLSRNLEVVPYAGDTTPGVNLSVQFAHASDRLTAGDRVLAGQAGRRAERRRNWRKTALPWPGHTDITGDARINLELSCARALAVRRYLGTKGVPAQRLTAYGFGSARLVEPGDPAAGSNRRVEIRKAPAS